MSATMTVEGAGLPAAPAPWVNGSDVVADVRLATKTLPSWATGAMLAQSATDYLWRATQRRFGGATITALPSRLGDACGWTEPNLAHLAKGWWTNYGSWLAFGCGVGGSAVLRLPTPSSVSAVTVDGAALPATSWRVVNDNQLVRTDGLPWPCCQAFDLPAGSVGTWSVTYSWGAPPPALGTMAAHELAVEYGLHAANPSAGRQQARVSQTVRQGVTKNAPSSDKDWHKMLTGIPVVDDFIRSVNEEKAPAGFYSPDSVDFARI